MSCCHISFMGCGENLSILVAIICMKFNVTMCVSLLFPEAASYKWVEIRMDKIATDCCNGCCRHRHRRKYS